ncbi:linear amide C-N hydrolase [Mycolicibacterium holsaticum]|uniref:linear amide C-N hydrolase n=1 Tax=Mycolicibacterium holsaticum TaxID=152142 RepID=UPI001C7D0DA8|nr:linear amide C-N hydrolase [Mycolicibacterium holsaticum]MDA4106702.1 choloylglycine hydrolase [Mycolicibacterium holsaticum DSM 44478 = JCM 12374]QZA13023.1 linear amide C-N hydrolase [Mycolicibacterium holsaticum DSM 44478 = JCM 12374]UNC09501.1 linear amide C-N hydrolase [Mycolicibacterium holsaticum DSM 44478 = JCM 12374]
MCTRVVYLGTGERIVTGRSMDWKFEIGTNLWALPRGVKRTGQAGPDSAAWTAKYGSVVATGYDICTTDGVNEAGLAANLLWLAESQYPANTGDRPAVALSLWAQYVLDNFATVAEAVAALTATPLRVVTAEVPGQNRLATLHLAISDASGDSAIVEYIDGEQVIHHGRQYQVMTNSPIFSKQLAITEYWQQIGGTVMLPGTNRAADRFVRAAFYIDAVPKTADPLEAVAVVLSVVRNVSVPYGITTADEPNISSTRWRTAVDHTSLRYFFESALSPNTFWVDLANLDFSEGAPAKRLNLGDAEKTVYAGDTSAGFAQAEPFTFLSVA